MCKNVNLSSYLVSGYWAHMLLQNNLEQSLVHHRVRVRFDARAQFPSRHGLTSVPNCKHVTVHFHATKIFKPQKNLNPSFMNKIFEEKDTPYTLRSGRNILAPEPSTTGYGIENARFLGAKIWRTITSSLEESQTLNSFKRY